MAKKTSIGGQAVIEGIMMKGPRKTALAVRTPDGSIDIEYISEKPLKDRYSFFGLPIIRGCVNFIESMITGYGAMMKSADKSGFTDIEEEVDSNDKLNENTSDNTESAANENSENTEEFAKSEETEKPKKADNTKNTGKQKSNLDKLTTVLMVVASILGVGLSIVLFMYLPALLFDLSNKLLSGSLSPFKAVFEGILKMIIFFIYILAVSKMKDIRRVFEYHGAEHKTIFCYEAGLELNVENVRKQSRFHPRCGTSFMILMLVVGILIGVVLTWCFPALRQSNFRALWVIIKILILPVICGVGYELLKLCGRHDNCLTRIIAAPGMWMQRITTKEPDDSMIEVAIASLEAVIPENSEEDNW